VQSFQPGKLNARGPYPAPIGPENRGELRARFEHNSLGRVRHRGAVEQHRQDDEFAPQRGLQLDPNQICRVGDPRLAVGLRPEPIVPTWQSADRWSVAHRVDEWVRLAEMLYSRSKMRPAMAESERR
jgi:hypothetical protein